MGGFLLGTALPLLLFFAGAYFAVTVGARWLCAPKRALGGMLAAGRGGGTSPWRAMTVALGGTLGVGNVAGVATAITLGGAGAVFWMWVAAFFAMPLKFAEVVLAGRYRTFDERGVAHGGAMYYIKVAFRGRAGRVMAAIFALLVILCMLTLGTVLQTHAAAEALSGVFGISPLLVGVVLSFAVGAILLGGSAKIEQACALVVPFCCLLFVVLSVAVLMLRYRALPSAFAAILRGAFTGDGALGGAFGVLTSSALRFGVARGIVSNEAGCGTAPIAHAAANAKTPVQQGFWGVFEVFVDTVLLCTLTALVILVSGTGTGEGVMQALSSYGAVLGGVAESGLALCVALFAFATVLCWSHYGAEALFYLTGKPRTARLVLPLIVLAVPIGAISAPSLVWGTTDVVLALLCLFNLAALLALARDVKAENNAFFEKT